MPDSEVWTPIEGCPGYEVSTHGRVRNTKRNRIKILSEKRNGYWQTTLFGGHRPRYCNVHRLVAEAFVPNPENKRYVNHKDGNKAHNHKDNLEWVTAQENTQHGLAMGLLTVGEARYNAILTEADVRAIRASSDLLRVLAARYGTSISNVQNVKQRISWKHVT